MSYSVTHQSGTEVGIEISQTLVWTAKKATAKNAPDTFVLDPHTTCFCVSQTKVGFCPAVMSEASVVVRSCWGLSQPDDAPWLFATLKFIMPGPQICQTVSLNSLNQEGPLEGAHNTQDSF